MPLRRRRLLTIAAGAGAGALSPSALWAQPRTPLLMEGKKTLYQRVLTRPGAALSAKAGEASGKPVEPFTVYFVYERVAQGGRNWLLVGAGSDGKTQGYLDEAGTVPWRHMMTLAFASPTTRQRVLFFRDRDGLMRFVDSADAEVQSGKYLKEIGAKGTLGAASPVIAAEPEQYVDLQKSFYLLPVLEAAGVAPNAGPKVQLVKVASVTRDPVTTPPPAAPVDADAGIANFNSAVVFVMDATSSMQPYIDRTYKAMETILKQADDARLGKRIRFGLVAFQDDPKKTKGVEYLSRVFADPNKTDRDQFLTAMRQVKATSSSTRAFAEDAYAGIDDALRNINWDRFGGRYIVYVTDASAREGDSPLASTRLATDELRANAQEKRVGIFALHLRTLEGKKDHETAERQFRSLTAWPGAGSLYFPVEAGDPSQFEAGVKAMAGKLVDQVKKPQDLVANPTPNSPKSPPKADPIDAIGRAMVLSYLGREQGVKAPPMFEAWASDHDVRNRNIRTFDVRVLLTKNQLSDLQSTVRRLAEAYTKTKLDPGNFFNELRSAAAAMGRDPTRLGQGKAKNLQEAGLMAEYLDGLPFNSPLMSMSFESWTNMGTGRAQEFVDHLESLVALYQRYHDDVDHWVKLNPAASDGDRVYPVRIDNLP